MEEDTIFFVHYAVYFFDYKNSFVRFANRQTALRSVYLYHRKGSEKQKQFHRRVPYGRVTWVLTCGSA